jgi:hypothetical protein
MHDMKSLFVASVIVPCLSLMPALGQSPAKDKSPQNPPSQLLFETNRAYLAATARSGEPVALDHAAQTETLISAMKAGGLARLTEDQLDVFDGQTMQELRDFLFKSSQSQPLKGRDASVTLLQQRDQKRSNEVSLQSEPIVRLEDEDCSWPISYQTSPEPDGVIHRFDICFEFSGGEDSRKPVRAFIYGVDPENPGQFKFTRINPETHEVYRMNQAFRIRGSNSFESTEARTDDLAPSYAAAIQELDWAIQFGSDDRLYRQKKVEWFRTITTAEEKKQAKKLLEADQQKQRETARTVLENAEKFSSDSSSLQSSRQFYFKTLQEIAQKYRAEIKIIDKALAAEK